MDIQLQELVEKIKKDGVDAADAKAADIVAVAKASAETILREARTEADSIVAKAKVEAARSEQASVSAIGQAGRNLLIEFRDGLVAELDALIRSGTAKAYDAEVLKKLVPETVHAWIKQGETDDIAVILSPADADRLESEMKSALKDEIAKGLEIRGSKSVSGGFRIALKDGSAYYDFSSEAVANLFSAYLSPRVSAILKSAAKES